MQTEFVIKKGTLLFEEDRICINDRVYKRDRYITLALAVSAVAYGVMTLIHYLATGGKHDFSFIIFGLLIAVAVPAIIYQCRLNYSPALKFDEIQKVIIRENALGMLTADFILQNRKKRHVVLDINREVNFERSTLPEFIKALKEKNIETDLR